MTTTTEAPVTPYLISRDFEAARPLLWEVFTTPEHLAKWFGPKGVEVIHVAMDLRVGGVYHYGYRSPAGEETWGKQQFLEIVAPEKLVYLQAFSDKDGGITRHPMAATWPRLMHATTTFTELSKAKTRLDVAWAPHDASEEEIATFDAARPSMDGGFAGMFGALEQYLVSLTSGRGGA